MTSSQRVLAAQVLLHHRLNSLLRLSDTVEIDASYVTCAEYQLFIDDKLKQGEYHQPDHWESTRFPRGDARKPVVGLHPSNATKFCEWLTEREGIRQGTLYRLPKVSEMRQVSVERTNDDATSGNSHSKTIGSWCEDPSGFACRVGSEVLDELATPRIADLPPNLQLAYSNAVNSTLTDGLDLDRIQEQMVEFLRKYSEAIYLARQPDLITHRHDYAMSIANRTERIARQFAVGLGLSRDFDIEDCIETALLRAVAYLRNLETDVNAALSRKPHERRQHEVFTLAVVFLFYSVLYQEKINERNTLTWRTKTYQARKTIRVLKRLALGDVFEGALAGAISLMVLTARLAGRLPAWEGIRIIRECT